MKKVKTHKSKFIIIVRWLLSLVILAVLMWFVYLRAGRLLCCIAIRQIGELTNTRISAGSINYQANGSIFINDFVVKPLKSENANTEILKAKKVFACFDMASLLLLKPRLNTIDVNDFVFNSVYDIDTGWSNLSDLAITPSRGSFHKIPNINLGSGILQYVKISKGHEEVAISVPIEADFTSDEQIRQKYNFNITTATMSSGYGQSHLSGSWKPGNVIITGGLASLNVPKFEMAWIIDVLAAELKYDKNGNFSLALAVKNMHSLRSGEPNGLSLEVPAFVEKNGLFTALQEFLDEYKPKGLMDIDLGMSGNFNNIMESEIGGSVNCMDVAFNYSGFQYPIEHLAGKIDFTQNKISYNNLKGKHGNSEFSFNGWYKNFGPNHEYKFIISSDKVPLGDDLYQALGTREQKFWSSFSPAGNINVDLEFEKHPKERWSMNLKVGLLDVDAVYGSFPYPLKNLTGRLIFSRDNIKIQDVTSQNGDIDIALNGEIQDHWEDNPIYNVSIKVNNIPMDSTLESALQEDSKRLYQRMKPSGLVDGLIQVDRRDSGDMHYVADFDFKETSIESDSLSEPVSDISAHAVFTPELIVVRDFMGKYGNIPVSLSGQISPDNNEQQLCYDVSLNLDKVQLNNKELTGLLPESIKKIVEQFDPNGSVNLIADLRKKNSAKPADYNVTVNCLGNSLDITGFPYHMTGVTGTMKVDSECIKLENISAFLGDNPHDKTVGTTKIFINGEIQIADGILKQAELGFSVKNIFMDEQFNGLLPGHCQDIYSVLSPAGCIDMNFKNFRLINEDDGRKTIEFDGEVALGGCDFKISSQPAKLDSVVKIQGKYASDSGFSNCKVLIDNGTLNILGKTFTALQTEFDYYPNMQKWSSEYLVTKTYGGKATGKCEFIQKDNSPLEYVLQTSFENVDLKKFLSGAQSSEIQSASYSTGKMNGSFNLSSYIAENQSRLGACRVTIKDMQIGKLSPLANLLQVLNLSEPSDYAFDSMFIDSYIRRDGLVVQKLDMSGKSVAFYGSGSIDLSNGGVNLSLTARGHRLATDDPSVLASLTEGLGQAVVRMDVTGDFNNMKIATKALPVIEGTLQIFGKKPIETN